MQNVRILLAEDEDSLRETIKLNLEIEGYTVVSVADGLEAIRVFPEERFNMVILDIMMPKVSGYDVCERIRLENSEVPILFLSAKNTTEDRIKGLKLGAHDYLTKPFNLEELLLRVGVLVRSSLKTNDLPTDLDTYSFGENTIDFKSFIAQTPKGEIQLTKREALLLKLLIEKKGQVVSREQILEKVWGYDVFPSTRTIDNFILSFRKYFEQDPRQPRYFHSIRSVGYKFTDPE